MAWYRDKMQDKEEKIE
jgi:cell division septum initiation protein DivIVA